MKKLYIKSYGCQMNVYDAERMADVMGGEGYETCDTPDDADMVILNTCHIREKAAEKVYSDVGRLRQIKDKRKTEGAKDLSITVAGCVAQAEGAEMIRRAPVIDMVVGPQAYHRLPDLLKEKEEKQAKGQRPRIVDTDFPVESKFDHLPKAKKRDLPSAFVTIQEGCDKFCTFCVVPYTRGAEFSRPLSVLLDEARALASEGVREITLLGQNVNAYHGEDASGREVGLGRLIREVAEIDGLERIRYTTSHPRDMDQDLMDAHRD
ncbi:MAG: MiaB/RimO family radical SAM methylthiotransferase, partial [Sphaerospermopsis sp. SIO1G1]|nr:MiaB/RimO family radical SAM methylthiotransferase [Sphaerospermopsis sp. SIO1G1]